MKAANARGAGRRGAQRPGGRSIGVRQSVGGLPPRNHLFVAPSRADGFPNLQAYLARLQARPAFQRATVHRSVLLHTFTAEPKHSDTPVRGT